MTSYNSFKVYLDIDHNTPYNTTKLFILDTHSTNFKSILDNILTYYHIIFNK